MERKCLIPELSENVTHNRSNKADFLLSRQTNIAVSSEF